MSMTSDEIVPVDLLQKLRTAGLYGAAFLAGDAADEIERLRASVELLRFAANEALTAIESDSDIERGWPNTVALLREALAKNPNPVVSAVSRAAHATSEDEAAGVGTGICTCGMGPISGCWKCD